MQCQDETASWFELANHRGVPGSWHLSRRERAVCADIPGHQVLLRLTLSTAPAWTCALRRLPGRHVGPRDLSPNAWQSSTAARLGGPRNPPSSK